MTDTVATLVCIGGGVALGGLMLWSVARAAQREYEQDKAEREDGR